jgi:hypothetical protein
MKKQATITLWVAAIASLLIFSGTPSFGGDDKSQSSDKTQQSGKAKNGEKSDDQELSSTYDSRYWGTPKKDISNDSDQQEYDRAQSVIPGIEVAKTEVFATFPGRNAVTLAPFGTGNLINHGGDVLSEVHIYPIFWGATTTNFSASYKQSITDFLFAIKCGDTQPACTGHSEKVKEYFGTKSPVIKYMTPYTDTTNPPSSSPSTASIVAETAKVVKASGGTIDSKGLYLVFTNNYPSRVNFCAWHSAGSYKPTTTSAATWFTVAYMPYVGTSAGCSPSSIPGFTTFKTSQAVHAVINVTTHELYEVMTDPLLNNKYAWYDIAGYENGDKCAWNYGSTINGYRVQSEYVNSTQSCPDLPS